ncbi:uncharacterized protein LOC128864736 [Anastrepha ludens]|uniref:uncharacterized protein LOC128864736 n=1 Tax=Anastrepha ludens TaxID=28586 RepID=UPI0023B07AC1|nr:uncharacterized protein LOC128864736 [Anastrepha ludens]
MRVFQANVHRSRTADALLEQIAIERELDAVIFSEQYGRIAKGTWFEDETRTVTLLVPSGSAVAVTQHGDGRCCTYIQNKRFTLLSCYLIPSDSIEQFRMKLDLIDDKVLEIGGPFIVAADFNAKAVELGAPTTNTRGRNVLDMAARLGLVVANTGNATRRPGCEHTTPDITLVTDSLAGAINGWEVLEEYTGSDHQYITFRISARTDPTPTSIIKGARKWNMAKMNTEAFLARFDANSMPHISGDAGSLASGMMQRIAKSCDAPAPCAGLRSRRRPVYWWTSEIADLRKTCFRNRRRYTRARRNREAEAEVADFRQSRKALKQAIIASKKAKWDELRNPWGLGYKILTGKLNANSTAVHLDSDAISKIVGRLLPTHPMLCGNRDPQGDEMFPPFTEEEPKTAARSLKRNKAPGPDGVPAEALKLVAESRSDVMFYVYNKASSLSCEKYRN